MIRVLLVGTDWRKVQISPNAFERGNEQLDIISLEIIDKVLDASDGLLVIDQFEFGELTDIL